MDEAGDERGPARVPAAVLACLVLIALGLGGWWWTSNAPEPVLAPPGDGARPVPRQPPHGEIQTEGPAVLADLLGGDELAAALLPRTDEAVLLHGTALGPGGSVVHHGAAPTSDDYLLEVACRGGGTVTVEITLPNLGPEAQELSCDGAVRGVVLSYRFGHAAIRVWTPPEADSTVLFAFQVRPL